MATYITKSGDTFDKIAYNELGSCEHTAALLAANRDKLETFIFSAGTEISLPEIKTETKAAVPPWR